MGITSNTSYGTASFISFERARAYYRTYGFTKRDVEDKLSAGEIAVGRPRLKRGERCWCNGDGRFMVEERAR